MKQVSIALCSSYEQSGVRRAMVDLLAPLGGMGAFILPGDRVLLKPNLLSAKAPDAAVTTHPAIVMAVAELVQEAGGIVLIGDSPGIGSFRTVAAKSGIAAAAEAAGAELVEFDNPVEICAEGTFRRIKVARAYWEADKIINLPKLKTHEMMTMTCAVKNLFGAVVGAQKAAWHLAAGESRQLFARLLLEIYLLKRPVLTIVDAVVAMEGDGPGSGDPVALGMLLAGANALSVDVIAGRATGIPPDLLHVEQEALRLEIEGSRAADIELVGASLGGFGHRPFRLPTGLSASFGLPEFLRRLLKRHLTPQPSADQKRCVLCGICRDACPPGVIEIKNSALTIDHGRCIHCWCCRELCPHHAMLAERGALLRVLSALPFGRKGSGQASSSSEPRGISR